MQYILIHCGYVVLFESVIDRCKDNTTLHVSLFQYSSRSKNFKKLNSLQSCRMHIVVKGHWDIVNCSTADCDVTGVIQPHALLYSFSESFDNCHKKYELYQFRNLKSFVKLFTVEGADCINEDLLFYNTPVHICNGPSLAMVDIKNKKLLVCKLFNNCLKQLSSSLRDLKSVHSFSNLFKGSCLKCSFLTHMCYSDSVDNLRSYQWMEVHISCDFSAMQMNVVYGEFFRLPSMYCSFAKQVLQQSSERFQYIISTSRCQLIMIGEEVHACDIPLSNCDTLNVIGENEYLVALIADQHHNKLCAVNLSTFKVVKVWNNVVLTTCGKFAVDEDVGHCVLLFHSDLSRNNIEREEFQILFDLKDVLKKKNTSFNDFNLKSSSDIPIEAECDLFSLSSVDEHFEESQVLSKVVMSFGHSVDKHKSALQHMRLRLNHYDMAISRSAEAISQMNNNIQEKQSFVFDAAVNDMVQLFSSSNIEAKLDEPEKSDCQCGKILKLRMCWQRIVCDNWIVGFDLTNLSKKLLKNFGVVLLSSNSSIPDNESSFTKVFMKIVPDDSSDQNQDKKLSIRNHFQQTDLPIISPGEDFTVTALYHLPSLFNHVENINLYSAAIAATATESSDKVVSASTHDRDFIIHVGSICTNAIDIAANKLIVDADKLSGSNADVWMKEFIAIRASHMCETVHSFVSNDTDMLSICQEVLLSIGFKYYESPGIYLCTNVGALHLVILHLQLSSTTSAEVTISSKSEFESALLLRCFQEQVQNNLSISQKIAL